ncbi:MAG: Uma2 family endonuclease [Peptococcaceae bacterium]|jgi:Uma2 family endonuclease|nr:Uma2 family endonuclease [Peptococcaceae bacterium]
MDGEESPNKQVYTLGEFMSLEVEEGARAELVGGELFMFSSPTYAHQRIVSVLCARFEAFFAGKTCKVCVAPLDVIIKEHCVQPDLIVLCDTAKIHGDGKCHGAPDLVVEVSSKSTEHSDRMLKLNLYRNNGVKEYWIVNPLNVEGVIADVFRFERGDKIDYMQYAGGDTAESFLFEGLTVDMNDLINEV